MVGVLVDDEVDSAIVLWERFGSDVVAVVGMQAKQNDGHIFLVIWPTNGISHLE